MLHSVQTVTIWPPSGRDGTARVWSLKSGQEVVRLKHAAKVEAVAFSPDGTTISTASFDGTARLWELPSGRERLRAVHPGGAEVLSVAPDASSVASGGMDGSVTVWNMSSGDQRARMVHSDEVRAVGFSPDGNLIATGSSTSVQVWTAEGIPASSPATMRSRVDRLLFSEAMEVSERAEGKLFHNSFVDVWEVATSQRIARLPQAQEIKRIAFHPRGTTLCIVAQPDDVQVWELAEGSLKVHLKHARDRSGSAMKTTSSPPSAKAASRSGMLRREGSSAN